MKLWASLRDHPKWVPLSLEQRGAWTTLALIACAAQPVRGEIASRAHATALLRREAPEADVDELVDRLVEAGLLDELRGGRLGLHDFDAWQVPPSQTKEANRERQRAFRERRNKGGVITNGSRNKEREKRPLEERALYREGAHAPLDESEIEDIDLQLVEMLLDPKSSIREDPDTDGAWLAAVAAAALEKLDEVLVADEREGLRKLARAGS